MRLGEIKQKVDKVLNAEKLIELKSINLGSAGIIFQIENYNEIIDVLHLLSEEQWTGLNKTEIEDILSRHPVGSNIAFSAEDFNKINSFINTLNSKLPVFYSLLETMVEVQEEQLINVKLPQDFNSLEELNRFNSRISTLFKSFQIDGDFEFKGFDKGSSWYEVLAVGTLTYHYFIGCLNIAQEFFKTKTAYFNSKEAKISYKIAQQKLEGLDHDVYMDDWRKAFIEAEVEILVKEKVKELNGETEQSLQTKLVIATTQLVKELGAGTEFHLSLNPPKYAQEQAGQLVIDYRKLQDLTPKKNQKKIEPIKLESQKEEPHKEGLGEA